MTGRGRPPGSASPGGRAARPSAEPLPPPLAAARASGEDAGPALPLLLVELLDRLPEGHALYVPHHDADGRVVTLVGLYMNPVGLALRGMEESEVVGKDLLARTRGQRNDAAADAYVTVVTTGDPLHHYLLVDGQSGRRRAYDVSCARVPTGSAHSPWVLSASFRDVTHQLDGRRRLQQTAKDLGRLASTDHLTGLLNRRGWEPALHRAVGLAGRDGAAPLCIAIADLDRFKSYNDLHGHLAGDELLREVAERWTEALPEPLVLARLGGEEFSVLLPGHDVEDATRVLDGLRSLMPHGQTVSIGLTRLVAQELGPAALGRADTALYSAKRRGRDRVVALLAPE